jgi:hypothetical protein
MSLAIATERLTKQLDNLESVTMPTANAIMPTARKPKLDPRPARKDLTSREIAKLLGGNLGSLLQMAKPSDVRDAVRWWAQVSDEEWQFFVQSLEAAGVAVP